jgi:UDP-N-acetylmuramoyl-L-alanyl-D-glutamate--2,6-diaminopimelate ligase
MARWFVDRLPQQGIPSVSLRQLLPGARFLGCPDWEVSGCTDDHRRLDPGQLFVAIRQPGYDGQAFIREALNRGAAGVVVEHFCPEAGRLQVVVDDARAAHSQICQALAGDPSGQLPVFGVAGNFGKTITSLFIRSILETAGLRSGVIGDSYWFDGIATRHLGTGPGLSPSVGSFAHDYPGGGSSLSEAPGCGNDTWPGGAEGLAAILAYMVEHQCAAGLVEVSKQALEARYFEGVAFQAAVLTDVGIPYGLPTETVLQDRRAYAKLFRKIAPGGAAVLNADDPQVELLGAVNLDARPVSFGLEHATGVEVSGRIERLDAAGSRFVLHGFDRSETVNLRLIGRRQVSHALAAAALAWALEIDRHSVVAGLEGVANIAGHLESVDEGQEFDLRIDAAAEAASLRQALAAIRAISAGHVHLVLSAEGNQERPTRRKLAETAERGADRIVLTLGCSRAEAPDSILDDLLGGFRRPGKVRVEPDRKLAIQLALSDARPGDSVLIAGRGRNAYQILGDRIIPFDDFAVARNWIRQQQARELRQAHCWA